MLLKISIPLTVGALAVILFLWLQTPPVQSAQGSQPDEDLYYYSHGQKIYLPVLRGLVAVGFEPSMKENERAEAIHGVGHAHAFGKRIRTEQPGLDLVRVDPEIPYHDLVSTVNELRGRDRVKFANPVFGTWRQMWVVTDEIIVRFKDKVARAQQNSLHRSHGAQIAGEHHGVVPYQLIKVPKGLGVSALKVANRYNEHPLVEYAHPNFIIAGKILMSRDWTQNPPNDPYFHNDTPADGYLICANPEPPEQWTSYGTWACSPFDALGRYQWSLHNPDGTDAYGFQVGVVDADINLPEAWTWMDANLGITNPGENVVVAVLDTGIKNVHGEFSNRLLEGRNFVIGEEWKNDNANVPVEERTWPTAGDPSEITVNWHGTEQAGIIGAARDNNTDITGIAPNCYILPVKICTGMDPNGTQQEPGVYGQSTLMTAWRDETRQTPTVGVEQLFRALLWSVNLYEYKENPNPAHVVACEFGLSDTWPQRRNDTMEDTDQDTQPGYPYDSDDQEYVYFNGLYNQGETDSKWQGNRYGNADVPLFHDAIIAARDLARGGKGAVLCCPAANDGDWPKYPSRYEESICVGGTNYADMRFWDQWPSHFFIDRDNDNVWDVPNPTPTYWNTTEFQIVHGESGHGNEMDIVAPSNVFSTQIRTCQIGQDWIIKDQVPLVGGGCSQAAPHVAGVAALLLQMNPELTASQVQAILQFSAKDQVSKRKLLEDNDNDNEWNEGCSGKATAGSHMPRKYEENGQFNADCGTNMPPNGRWLLYNTSGYTPCEGANYDCTNDSASCEDQPGWDPYMGWGRLDAQGSVIAATRPRFILRDVNGIHVASIDDQGNMVLEGLCFSLPRYENMSTWHSLLEGRLNNLSGTDNEFVIRNSAGQNQALLICSGTEGLNDSRGDLYLRGTVQIDQGTLTPPAKSFIVRDDGGTTVAYIDSNTGNLYLRGKLFENRSSDKYEEDAATTMEHIRAERQPKTVDGVSWGRPPLYAVLETPPLPRP